MPRTEVRKLPAVDERVETGPVQFGDNDYPGVFIRGDNAFHFALNLVALIELDDMHPRDRVFDVMTAAALRGLASTLASCVIGQVGDKLRAKLAK